MVSTPSSSTQILYVVIRITTKNRPLLSTFGLLHRHVTLQLGQNILFHLKFQLSPSRLGKQSYAKILLLKWYGSVWGLPEWHCGTWHPKPPFFFHVEAEKATRGGDGTSSLAGWAGNGLH
jgi:hypothetical protein